MQAAVVVVAKVSLFKNYIEEIIIKKMLQKLQHFL